MRITPSSPEPLLYQLPARCILDSNSSTTVRPSLSPPLPLPPLPLPLSPPLPRRLIPHHPSSLSRKCWLVTLPPRVHVASDLSVHLDRIRSRCNWDTNGYVVLDSIVNVAEHTVM